MRSTAFAVLAALALAACDQPPQSKVSALPPPPEQPPAAAVPAAPQPSANAQLVDKVKSALNGARELDAQGVDVTVTDGVVTLYGTVPEPELGHKISVLVSQVDGVRSVVNNLVVIRGS